jgi:hypothetical protein
LCGRAFAAALLATTTATFVVELPTLEQLLGATCTHRLADALGLIVQNLEDFVAKCLNGGFGGFSADTAVTCEPLDDLSRILWQVHALDPGAFALTPAISSN